MRFDRHRRRHGWTLIELVMVIVVVAVVAALALPRLFPVIRKAMSVEAVQNLGAIRRAELMLHQFANQFVNAPDHPAIQSQLGLSVDEHFYRYEVIDATAEDFLALAIPVWPYNEWLETVAISKDGLADSVTFAGYGPGQSIPGSSGGTSGGGSGGTGGSGGGGGIGGAGGGGGVIFGGGSSGGGEQIIFLSEPVVFSINVPVPTGLLLVPNDGWITMAWVEQFSNLGYRVYRSESEDGPFTFADSFFETYVFGSGVWEDQVMNGTRYCYQVTAVADTTIGTFESAPSETVCGQSSADVPPEGARHESGKTYGERASDAKAELLEANEPILRVDGIPNGAAIKQFLDDFGVPILFGNALLGGALAYHNPITNALVLDASFYMNSADEVLADLLAHETLHRIWDVDYEEYLAGLKAEPEYGMPIPGGGVRHRNSIDQEYRSFLSAAQVWRQIKGDLTDPQLDDAMKVVTTEVGCSQGEQWCFVPESEAKELLVSDYGYGYLSAY